MTVQNETRLAKTIKENWSVEITVVNENDKVIAEEIFSDFDEAKAIIEFYEIENTVYF